MYLQNKLPPPELRFEDQRLSPFSGLVVIQALIKELALGGRLKGCFEHLQHNRIVGFNVVTLLLIVHLMLGYRRLREVERYQEDPLVLLLGLSRMPDISTVTRRLSQVDREGVRNVGEMNLERWSRIPWPP
jgi:hypothetical protein